MKKKNNPQQLEHEQYKLKEKLSYSKQNPDKLQTNVAQMYAWMHLQPIQPS
jgi:fructose-1,6-bisphosphatase